MLDCTDWLGEPKRVALLKSGLGLRWFGLLVDAFFPAQQKNNRNEDLKFGEPAVKSVKGLLLIQDPSCEYPL